ncbi:tyrosinase family protein [Pseudoalteromonas luteoviolacea]|uniref:Tyrosinase copper-binding domain-containing protein n=1 Tax=Pseudoalteromonas luteoviolacea S4054 TaxID=1129367 RepID=A0A0F6AHE7_9GAMM|nr:tyrosinase family protein [Pseudoalteromonas luteoviolacea]AOT08735.1 hypothetical protein S4054249_13110 [Pseudoalteromonas luteoviolacea]AOT13650.1 hypothetical protein S40542_13085 [Pseudoalteromonas luteoviolacea]AOT18563.1 hypothetical protein S4054_13085 [Pseudoalteromonas luteoviolacea]KKE85632.1 hypothetical protein N479_25545 [Pseudoalteromonas luteoviolacea S4054]KZN68165.1 hypothetical protein N481_23225 [Pseudoalteromonas luteoviolacea S4047-1]
MTVKRTQRKNLLNQNLNDQSSDLYWYNEASKAMRNKDVNDPTSWGWWAAVHQYASNVSQNQYWTSTDVDGQDWVTNLDNMDKSGNAQWWAHCPHGDPKFLPWHRAYILAFENALLQVISTLPNAPAQWAMPFWDYTTSGAEGFSLPPAFKVNNNSLYFLNRYLPFNAEQYYSDTVTSTVDENFEQYRAAIENIPHNVVHTGLRGAMQSIRTAGLDPIFYTHHCQIDRLWAIWSSISTTTTTYNSDGYFKWLYVEDGIVKAKDAKIAFNDCMSTTDIPVTDLSGNLLDTLSYDYETAPFEQQFINSVLAQRTMKAPMASVSNIKGGLPMPEIKTDALEQLIFASSTRQVKVSNSSEQVALKSLEQKSLANTLALTREVSKPEQIHSLTINIDGVVTDGDSGNYLVILDELGEGSANVVNRWQIGYVSFFGSTVEDGKTALTGGKPMSVRLAVPHEHADQICGQCMNNKRLAVSLVPEYEDADYGIASIEKITLELKTQK